MNDGNSKRLASGVSFTASSGQKTLAAWTDGGTNIVGATCRTVGGGESSHPPLDPFSSPNPSTVPEPGSSCSLARGSLALLAWGWRKRKWICDFRFMSYDLPAIIKKGSAPPVRTSRDMRVVGTGSVVRQRDPYLGASLMKAAIMALPLSCLLVADAGAQLPSAAVPYGLSVSIHPTSGNVTFQDLDMIKAAGISFVRTDLFWNQVETTAGVYNFSTNGSCNYDAWSQACAARGLRVVYTLDYGNGLYGSDPSSLAWQQAYANYAAAAAEHFKGDGDIYQVWQEPDGSWSWPKRGSNRKPVHGHGQAGGAGDAQDGSCTIWGPDISNAEYAVTNFLKPCLQQGLASLVDAISVHPYRTTAPETVVADYTTIGTLVNRYRSQMPIVSSEWGYSCSTDTSDQFGGHGSRPRRLPGRMLLVNYSQGIRFSNWYDWKDDEIAGSEEFGLVTSAGVAKPAYNELKLLTASLHGETFSGSKLSDGNSNDWLLVFTGGGHTTLAAWTTQTGGHMSAVVPGWGTYNLTATPFYVNPTLLPGDANLDGTVNVQDWQYWRRIIGSRSPAVGLKPTSITTAWSTSRTWPFWRPTTGTVWRRTSSRPTMD